MLDGWHTDEDDDLDLPPLDQRLMDTSGCPVADRCAGCGATVGLHAVTSAFTKPGDYEIGCATLCAACDGQSFLHLLSSDQFSQPPAQHSRCRRPGCRDRLGGAAG